MKILIMTHHFYPCVGGIETYVATECKYLKKYSIETEIVTLNKCPKANVELPQFGTLDGTKIVRLKHLKIGPIIFAPGILKQAMRKDIAAIHCHAMGFFLDFLVIAKPLHKKKIFFTTHGGIFHTKKFEFLKKIYFNIWERIIFRGVDMTIAVSKNDLEKFSKITKKITLIEDSFDSEEMSELGKTKKKNTFLFVGRLFKNKRCDNLIRTFATLNKKNSNFKLFIVGSDWGEKENLERLSYELGLSEKVIFELGTEREKLKNYYDFCEFFVSASEYEGFGISVVEAMAARCIPILNDIPTFREFTNSGKIGYIVDYSKPESAAETILQAMEMNDKEKKLIAEKAHNAVQKYSWENSIKKLIKIFTEIR